MIDRTKKCVHQLGVIAYCGRVVHSLNHNVLQNKNDNVQNQILTSNKEKASLSKQLITCEKQCTEMQIEHTALLHKYDTLVTETEHLSKLFNQKHIEQTVELNRTI